MSRADDDGHEHDLVMPGFRFHPTEEELIEFYLRRKVEGKRFNVELITFLDLYRHDPWELPALAAIGEKEWFFYVPRDRKYRNGDRPNRVTRSGYWKATGAGRAVRSESSMSPIGVKKTLVFYSGKAPKGVRTSWIMNEYRLPQSEIERNPKADISLCRVYSRAGVEDRHQFPGMASYKHASSSSEAAPEKRQSSSNQKPHAGFQSTIVNGDDASSSPMLEGLQVGVASAETNTTTPSSPAVLYGSTATSLSPATSTDRGDISTPVHHQPKNTSDALIQAAGNPHLSSSNPSFVTGQAFDELCKLANLNQMMGYMSQQPTNHLQIQMPSLLAQSRQLLPLLNGVSNLPLSAISDDLWECNPHLPGSS